MIKNIKKTFVVFIMIFALLQIIGYNLVSNNGLISFLDYLTLLQFNDEFEFKLRVFFLYCLFTTVPLIISFAYYNDLERKSWNY